MNFVMPGRFRQPRTRNQTLHWHRITAGCRTAEDIHIGLAEVNADLLQYHFLPRPSDMPTTAFAYNVAALPGWRSMKRGKK